MQVKLGSPTSYDALTVNGTATLGGNLSVFRYTNYLPVRGVEFDGFDCRECVGASSRHSPIRSWEITPSG